MSTAMVAPKNKVLNPFGEYKGPLAALVNPNWYLDKAGLGNKNLTPSTPEPQTAIAPPPELAAPTAADPAAQKAAEDALKKAKRNQGRAATILSGTAGENTTSAGKTLLGA